MTNNRFEKTDEHPNIVSTLPYLNSDDPCFKNNQTSIIPEETNKNLKERRKKIGIKLSQNDIQMLKKSIKISSLISALFLLGVTAENIYAGKIIEEKISGYIKEFNITDTTVGLMGDIKGVKISMDSIIHDAIENARDDGMTDADIAVGLKSYFPLIGGIYVSNHLPDVTEKEMDSSRYKALEFSELKEKLASSNDRSRSDVQLYHDLAPRFETDSDVYLQEEENYKWFNKHMK